MAAGNDIPEFMTTRRARLTPKQAGLRAYGGRRRVSGLRREEVALLAGISVEYYTQLERGNVRGVSEDVLDAIARGLQLDDERSHLFDLVRTAKQHPAVAGQHRRGCGLACNGCWTRSPSPPRSSATAASTCSRPTASGIRCTPWPLANPQRPTNLARFVFLDPRSRDFYMDWDGIADAGVGSLRAEAGRDPYDAELTNLIGELSMRSEEFRIRWATHDRAPPQKRNAAVPTSTRG